MSANVDLDHDHDDILYPQVLPFLLVHAGCVAAIWSGVSWQAVAICVGLYGVRMFAIGAGYHRYFSHRAYSTSRVFQFILAFLAQSSAQKASFGGPRNIDITIFIRIPSRMCIHPGTRASCTVTSAGSFIDSMMKPIHENFGFRRLSGIDVAAQV